MSLKFLKYVVPERPTRRRINLVNAISVAIVAVCSLLALFGIMPDGVKDRWADYVIVNIFVATIIVFCHIMVRVWIILKSKF